MFPGVVVGSTAGSTPYSAASKDDHAKDKSDKCTCKSPLVRRARRPIGAVPLHTDPVALNIFLLGPGCLLAVGVVLRFPEHPGHVLRLGSSAALHGWTNNWTFLITQPRSVLRAVRGGR